MDIRIKVTLDCIKRLEAAGCLYHIMDHEGKEYGAALAKPVVETKGRKMNPARSVERNKYLLPYLLQLEVGGDPVDIPYHDTLTVDELQSNVGVRLAQTFGGDGSYITSRDNGKRMLQVMLMRNDTKMGAAQAIVRSYSGGKLSVFAEEALEAFTRNQKTALASVKKVS